MIASTPTHFIAGGLRRLGLLAESRLRVHWIKRGGWLGAHLIGVVPPSPRKRQIERAARATNQLGAHALAEEYGESGAVRTPDMVRSSSECGDLYAWFVRQRRPVTVVEFGAAFGVSGMYFGAALNAARHGHLYSFEINPEWAAIAERNIASVCDRFTLTRGAFEDHAAAIVPGPVDLAFVDAIHTYEFVMRQFGILRTRMRPGGLVLLDDIDFRKPGARMREAWEEIASRADVAAAAEVEGRLGVIELSA